MFGHVTQKYLENELDNNTSRISCEANPLGDNW